MYLSSAEYLSITGETAPSDFAACLTLAEAMIDGQTLTYYAQTDLTALPANVLAWLKQATAYQVQAISHGGGISGATDNEHDSITLGRFSYSGKTETLCLPASSLLPYLVAYVRGKWSCQYPTIC